MKELDALHEVLQQTARSDTANVVTQTGQSQANRIRTIGATATLGVSMGVEAGFGAMMRLYESKQQGMLSYVWQTPKQEHQPMKER